MPQPEQILQEAFGHSTFRDGQSEVVKALLEGHSCLAIFPTGAGKSLCYQLPALMKEGLTLVISPLIALMKDQVERLQRKNIAAERLDSTLSAIQIEQVLDQMTSGHLKLLYIAPERLLNERFLRHLRKTQIAMMAVDEAHCISEWGHNFRPEYLRLAKVAEELQIQPILALTATATPKVADQIAKGFQIRGEHRYQTTFHRPNLFLQVSTVEDRLSYLSQALRKKERLPAIVYVTLQSTAEMVATYLLQQGFNAKAYHAGLPTEFRSETQEAFLQGKIELIVATIAFGMGIDKSNVRAVFHYNLPKTLENYQQEIGRAGRDGKLAHCEVLAHLDDKRLLQNFIYGDTPSPLAIQGVLSYLLRQGAVAELSLYETTRSFDIKPAVLETLLTYLELLGQLQPAGSYYSKFQWTYERNEHSALSGLSKESLNQLYPILSKIKRGYKWMSLDVREACQDLDLTPNQISAILNDWASSKELTLKPSHLIHVFRNTQSGLRPELIHELQKKFEYKETQELQRIHEVVEFLKTPDCLTNRLIHYFGERTTHPCGHCDVCLADPPLQTSRVLPQSPPQSLTVEDIEKMKSVRTEGHAALRHPRAFTRFLCGISSPALTRDKLQQHADFGIFEHFAFEEIYTQAQTFTW